MDKKWTKHADQNILDQIILDDLQFFLQAFLH